MGYLGDTKVSTISELAAYTGTDNLVWVESVLCFWHRHAASTLTPDGITIVAANIGNWERLTCTTSHDWLAQTDWFINSVSGEDENSGSSALEPLATFDELNRRLSVGQLKQDTTVTVSADTVLSRCVLHLDIGSHLFSIVGTTTTVKTDTISSFTTYVHTGTPVSSLLKASGISDWSVYEGLRCRVTSGSQTGAICWIGRANPTGGTGVDTARVNRFASYPFGAAVTPTAGSDIVLESLPFIGDVVEIVCRSEQPGYGDSSVFLDSLAMGKSVQLGSSLASFDLDGCSYNGGGSNTTLLAELNNSIGGAWSRRSLVFNGDRLVWNVPQASLMHRSTIKPLSIKYGAAISNSCGDGAGFDYASGVGGTLFNSQIFDAAVGIQINGWASIYTSNGLSGAGNGIGLQVGLLGKAVNCLLEWANNGAKPNILGTTTPIRIQGSTVQDLAWTATPYSGDEQRGVSSALSSGQRNITARNASLRGVIISPATGAGTTRGLRVEAVTASRTATQFNIKAVSATGATQTTDTSTVDWHIPGAKRGIRICQRDSLV